MSGVEVGVRYCVTHHGIANEDDDVCDFYGAAGTEGDCEFRALFYEEPK